ncbi:MAG: DUF3883 domain-containing protein [Ktedonobacteraceae bacterium]
MPRKLAIKRLTASELSFFKWQYYQNPSSKQKAINLNADVFVDRLYPGLGDPSSPGRFPVDVLIYGPGLEGSYNLQRKILKSHKNWRLNGEIVANPEGSLQRFDALTVGDFVIFDFNEGLYPSSVTLLFLAAAVPEDKKFHQALDQFLGTRTMIALTPSELDEAIKKVDPVPTHHIYELTLDTDKLNADVEDAALGGSRGRTRLRASTRKLSRQDFQKAKENADMVGLAGEQFVNEYLQQLKAAGRIHDFEWVSAQNAISPYDFSIDHDGTGKTFVDVKSTQGEFERVLHVSYNELLQMRTGTEQYDIYRVYDINESSAKLRITSGIREFAASILEILEHLPEGISSDGISFSPTALSFGTPMALEMGEQQEEEDEP